MASPLCLVSWKSGEWAGVVTFSRRCLSSQITIWTCKPLKYDALSKHVNRVTYKDWPARYPRIGQIFGGNNRRRRGLATFWIFPEGGHRRDNCTSLRSWGSGEREWREEERESEREEKEGGDKRDVKATIRSGWAQTKAQIRKTVNCFIARDLAVVAPHK